MAIFKRKDKPELVDRAPTPPRVAVAPLADPPVAKALGPISDEGVPYRALDTETVLNVSTDPYDARRRELHVHGIPYMHVAEHATGQWIYRFDR